MTPTRDASYIARPPPTSDSELVFGSTLPDPGTSSHRVPPRAQAGVAQGARAGRTQLLRLKHLMRELNLHTVCEEAHCPNVGECWEHGTATFMILGDVCTRNCGVLRRAHGRPPVYDVEEPQPRRGGDRRNAAASRRDHVRRSRRPRRLRRLHFRRDDSAGAHARSRAARSRSSSPIFRAMSVRSRRCSRHAPTFTITTPKPYRGCTGARGPADATSG